MDYGLPPTPEQLFAQQQQQVAQHYWAMQQRQQAQHAWLVSTQPVGTLLAIGLFLLAGFRLLLTPLSLGMMSWGWTVLLRMPLVGALMAGALTAVGWWIILARRPRGAARVVAILGLLVGAMLAVTGASGLVSADLFGAVTRHSLGLLELATTALTLIGVAMWRGSGALPVTAILGWCGLALMGLLLLLSGLRGGFGGTLGYEALPALSWVLTGVAAFGMRAARDGLPGGMPSAVVVQR